MCRRSLVGVCLSDGSPWTQTRGTGAAGRLPGDLSRQRRDGHGNVALEHLVPRAEALSWDAGDLLGRDGSTSFSTARAGLRDVTLDPSQSGDQRSGSAVSCRLVSTTPSLSEASLSRRTCPRRPSASTATSTNAPTRAHHHDGSAPRARTRLSGHLLPYLLPPRRREANRRSRPRGQAPERQHQRIGHAKRLHLVSRDVDAYVSHATPSLSLSRCEP